MLSDDYLADKGRDIRRKFLAALDERIVELIQLDYRGPLYVWETWENLSVTQHMSTTAPDPWPPRSIRYDIDDAAVARYRRMVEAR